MQRQGAFQEAFFKTLYPVPRSIAFPLRSSVGWLCFGMASPAATVSIPLQPYPYSNSENGGHVSQSRPPISNSVMGSPIATYPNSNFPTATPLQYAPSINNTAPPSPYAMVNAGTQPQAPTFGMQKVLTDEADKQSWR